MGFVFVYDQLPSFFSAPSPSPPPSRPWRFSQPAGSSSSLSSPFPPASRPAFSLSSRPAFPTRPLTCMTLKQGQIQTGGPYPRKGLQRRTSSFAHPARASLRQVPERGRAQEFRVRRQIAGRGFAPSSPDRLRPPASDARLIAQSQLTIIFTSIPPRKQVLLKRLSIIVGYLPHSLMPRRSRSSAAFS